MEECVLHQMAQFVELLIIFTLYFAVFLGRYHGLHALIFRLFKDGVRIVAFVSKQCFGGESFDQAACLGAIRCCTLCNNSPDRHTMRIHGKMELCVEPPFVRLMS